MVLYQNQYQQLYAFGCRVHADREVVKDCIHEMFCEIWNGRHRVQSVSNSRSYLFTYLKRKILKEVQRVKLSDQLPEDLNYTGDDLQEASYEDILVKLQTDEATRIKLQQVLSKLSQSQLEIIRMKFYEELSFEQIASILNIETRTVYNHIYEALKRLRQHMKVLIPFLLAANDVLKIISEKVW
ncbi:sigma-70 family RNA polymerase sigma factor [Pontibacter sp. Tf4]|nr:sigma-70 family RNA polymerase sigma factor [Pontibacter sp. Tf4]MBB6612642.1 sigma-70 family RNA polymerase sigma factor [Pontibacter sp. Tf4]